MNLDIKPAPDSASDLPSMIHRLSQDISFIVGLIQIGEEPYEYEYNVNKAAELCEKAYGKWLSENGLGAYEKNLLMFVSPFIRYRYLCHPLRSNKRSLAIYPALKKRFIEGFFESLKVKEPGMQGFIEELMLPFEEFLRTADRMTTQ